MLDLQAAGGLFSFLGHQVSTVALGVSWQLPVVKTIALALNFQLIVKPSVWLDRMLESGEFLPLGYLCTAERR